MSLKFIIPSEPVQGIIGSEGKVSAYSAGDRVQSLGQEDALEKEMVPHFSTLAWKIPWMDEPGRL